MPHNSNQDICAVFSEQYRHETKYLITDQQAAVLRTRLRAVMHADSHSDIKGSYLIRSIYFDDYDDNCLRENADGTDVRTKWRLRFYNLDNSTIFLEAKSKIHGMTRKDSCIVTESQFEQLVRGKAPAPNEEQGLLIRFNALLGYQQYRPKIIVQYKREPFICSQGNVRVTLDSNICSGRDCMNPFSDELAVRPVLPLGVQLLEIKYDAFLPDLITHTVQMDNLRMTSFSKYYICRTHSY